MTVLDSLGCCVMTLVLGVLTSLHLVSSFFHFYTASRKVAPFTISRGKGKGQLTYLSIHNYVTKI